MNRILVDTNVLVYSIDKDSKYFQKSQNLLFDPNFELYTTCKNISELLAVITRIPGKSLSISDALLIMEDFSKLLTVLYPNPASFSIFKQLLKEYRPTGLNIHDFEIASITIAHRITQIATFNTKDFDSIDELTFFSF